ncbi:nuclear transport factor 2 family protein [Rhodococcus sp. BS-15]|uniref:nuclear transport factor 2 family protein n=1 Tax=Rhodococcus sp. BS-15 TaxID=1304954 RepID=UPI000FFBFC31|nr:nuclear transport factor 2 family protein [Rhodococcus sp. BS-15]
MTALDARQGARALTLFTADAVVTDEGHDHSGRGEIEAWLTASVSESEYTYTTEFTGATTTGTTVDVVQHLEGNFPGGVVDLHYRFTLDGALIQRLVIEP